jgi:thiol-disulfide isomerase/thioredoxin
LKRVAPLLFGAIAAAILVRGGRRRVSSTAPRLSDGTPRAQVLFFQASWCPACEKAKPEIRAIAKRHPSIVFTDVDIEKDPEMASRFSVSSIPTFVALIDGKEVDRREGFKNGTDLESFVSTFENGVIETADQKALEP